MGYLPTGVLPTGHLPTGADWTTGCGRGRSAATAVPTKANDAMPTIPNFNMKSPVAARDEPRIDLYDHDGAINRRPPSQARDLFTDVTEIARVQPDLVLASSGRCHSSLGSWCTHDGCWPFRELPSATLNVRVRGAGSTGRRNTGVKSLCWCFKLQGLTWSFI
jgi:hypothetical protein